jgi:hypothetical protein
MQVSKLRDSMVLLLKPRIIMKTRWFWNLIWMMLKQDKQLWRLKSQLLQNKKQREKKSRLYKKQLMRKIKNTGRLPILRLLKWENWIRSTNNLSWLNGQLTPRTLKLLLPSRDKLKQQRVNCLVLPKMPPNKLASLRRLRLQEKKFKLQLLPSNKSFRKNRSKDKLLLISLLLNQSNKTC